EQAGKTERRENRDDQRQIRDVLDQQKALPIVRSAIEALLQPQKAEGDRGQAQSEAAGVVTRPAALAGEERADDREEAEHDELGPEGDPRPVFSAEPCHLSRLGVAARSCQLRRKRLYRWQVAKSQ